MPARHHQLVIYGGECLQVPLQDIVFVVPNDDEFLVRVFLEQVKQHRQVFHGNERLRLVLGQLLHARPLATRLYDDIIKHSNPFHGLSNAIHVSFCIIGQFSRQGFKFFKMNAFGRESDWLDVFLRGDGFDVALAFQCLDDVTGLELR